MSITRQALQKRAGAFVFALSFALFLFSELYQETNLFIRVEKTGPELCLTQREAKYLRALFHSLLIWDPFGYTFMGCKPLSFSDYEEFFSSFSSLCPPNFEKRCGWICWQKQLAHFPSSRFVFWEEENPWVNKRPLLVVMDRDQTAKVFQKNRKDFERYLPNAEADFALFLANPRKNALFRDVLKRNDFLIGILLGFGRENAHYYAEYYSKRNQKIQRPSLIWGTASMEQEVRNLWWKEGTFQKMDLSDMLRPGFVGRPDTEESKQLKERFLAAKKHLIEYYRNKDFLEATLCLVKRGPILREAAEF